MTFEHYVEEEHYGVVAEWFGHYGEIPHFTQLPPLGSVVLEDGKPIAAVWAYEAQGMGIAFVEWLICKPDLPPTRKLRASIAAAEFLVFMLKSKGVEMIRSTFTDPRIASIACEYFGWQDVGLPCRHVMGRI